MNIVPIFCKYSEYLTIANIVQGMSPFFADYSMYLFLTKQLTASDLMTAILIFSGDNNGKRKATIRTVRSAGANIFRRVTRE